MPHYIRPRIPGACIFFTVNLATRGDNTLVREIATLRRAVAEVRADRPFRIDAWVILPDHMHAVWTLPEGDADYSTRWKDIKARFTKYVGGTYPRSASQQAKGEKGLWQRRFWDHHLRNETAREQAIHYCWFNPVKHGLVHKIEDWPFSTWHRARTL
ncbi:REP-associated tyrosine transposase [Neogemmobacter tilapiae]|uniref:Transposase n=1 Tax=Neogemmobacter tilapiae TaxID=875041 RepID=A0A918WNA1_9RHOB|nr:transposase [Gemmobacter tilapiae]GHC62152.1 transposase [Gemmobacter tilapiae]